MSPPRRRSARLNSGQTPVKSRQSPSKLSSLIEGEDTPKFGAKSNLNAIMSSPTLMPSPLNIRSPAKVRTPGAATPLYPSFDEMHPSKAQQSTTKQPDSGLRLGFSDVKTKEAADKARLQETPSKIKGDLAKPPSSPGFVFKFGRPGTELGSEAQKMMDDLREEALRIKAKLEAEKAKEEAKCNEATGQSLHGMSGRKIASAKGKAGRFSDVHMAEFKKMDSIAGHASAYRAKTNANSSEAPKPSLKRSKSQAKLDEPDAPSTCQPRTGFFSTQQTTRLEKVSPTKRMKQYANDDTSAARPGSRDGPDSLIKSRAFPSTVTTPTKASLARSASAKKFQKNLTPSLARAASSRALQRDGTKSESSTKYLSSLTNLARMKSILRRPQIFTSKDLGEEAPPVAQASSPFKINLDKDLPALPTTPSATPSKIARAQSIKRVNFTPTTQVKTIKNVATYSPSPMHATIQRSPSSKSKVAMPTIVYPTLPRPTSSSSATSAGSPSRPTSSAGGGHSFADFNIRPTNLMPGSFGPATATAATIRAVRPSIIGSSGRGGGSELPAVIPAAPHGLPNKSKKRGREEDDDVSRDDATKGNITNRSPKKKRTGMGEKMWMSSPIKGKGGLSVVELEKEKENGMEGEAPRRKLAKPRSRIPSPAKGTGTGKAILGLSRLNALARPKERGGA